MLAYQNKNGSFTQSESKKYSDILDRELAREFLYKHKNYTQIKFGNDVQIDLMFGNSEGCDVEFLTFDVLNSFKNEGGFRLPNRKKHYWNESPLRDGKKGKWNNEYKDWKVDYIQFFDNRMSLLYTKSESIKPYINNIIYRDVNGWEEKNKYFIKLPYDECKDLIELYRRDEFGKWNKENF